MARSRLRSPVSALFLVLTAGAVVFGGAGPGGGGGGTAPDPAIVFEENGIKVMNDDGSNVQTILSVRRGERVSRPNWSPDGSEVVFWGHLAGLSGIYRMPLAGEAPVLVCPTLVQGVSAWSSVTGPSWSPMPSPDGQHKIAFSQRDPATGDYDVYLVNPDGTGLFNLTCTPSLREASPAWSMDGQRLAATRGNLELVVWTLGAVQAPVEIVGERVYETWAQDPAWGKSSNLLAFSTAWQIAVMDADAAEPMVALLTPPSAGVYEPSFSPDDSRLVFRYGGGNGAQLYGMFTMNIFGGDLRRISRSGVQPMWRPMH